MRTVWRSFKRNWMFFLLGVVLSVLATLALGCQSQPSTTVLPARTELERTDNRGASNTRRIRQTFEVEVGPEATPFRLEDLAPYDPNSVPGKRCPA
jgi:hypothetical protein